MSTYIIEIASSDFETTRAAIEGGADRIELCANLAEGGTTPSAGMIEQCRNAFDTAIYPIIRRRGGDFFYTEDAFRIMLKDVVYCKEAGCDGIVTGMLQADGDIAVRQLSILVNAAYPMGVTFHRAFDRCKEPFSALETIINAGCERILTSGQQPAAMEGIELIKELITAADNRISIMPGSGVRVENIKELATHTGAVEFHSSLRSKTKSRMDFYHPAFVHSEESYSNNAIDPEDVRALRNALLNS
jgi:copper homeostasis protein